ncbi:hypothetical protein N665_3999s0001 [Sinapis alba]|nr:hypothetical protein N665_3999s0001 [Sinapis alba]
MNGGNDGSEVDPMDSSRSGPSFDVKNSNFPSETSSCSSISEGTRHGTTIDKNCMVDHSSNLVNSGTGPQVFVDNQGEQSPLADSDVETNSEDTLDDETDCVTVTNAVAGVDSRTADVSVLESHEDTLENGVPMPAELDSKLTSGFNSGGEKLVGDASPTRSKCDEQISDVPAEFHSSYTHNEGFHELPWLDNTATYIVPKEDLAVSGNHADISSDDVNQTVSLSSPSLIGSLPWISTNTSKLSSEAGGTCDDTAVGSNGTLTAENKIQKSPLELSSEGLGTSLDNNDLGISESSSPMTYLDRSDRDTETKSPCQSILDENRIDSSPVNNLNLLESLIIEQSVKVQTPYASHALEDEALVQSSVSRELEFVPHSAGLELDSPKQELNKDPIFPNFCLIPETIPPNQEDMPPLPPLPPMQWRIGKAPHSFTPTFMGESGEASSSAPSATSLIGSSLNIQTVSKASELPVFLGTDNPEQLPGEVVTNASEKPLQSIQLPSISTDLDSQYNSLVSQRTQSSDLSDGRIEEFGSEENNLLADHAAQNQELVHSQGSSLQLSQGLSAKKEDYEDDTDVHVSESSSCPETEALTPTQSTKVEDNVDSVPDAIDAETAEPSNLSVQKIVHASVGDAMWPVSAFTVAPTLDKDKLEEVPMIKLPRPRSPLVDAVAAHDRRTLKKVSERVQPPIKSKQDDKDSLLAQIRNKSVSLKPAVATRPSIQTGPKTNLRVAAILEKANTIRQAMVGSDEDEDSDSWSDS